MSKKLINGGWVSVTEKLPRQGQDVLIFWKNHQNKKFIDVAACWKGDHCYDRKSWHFSYCDVDGSNMLDDSQVTHWQPLPKYPIAGRS